MTMMTDLVRLSGCRVSLLLLALLGGLALSSCDRLIYDDLSECPQGVRFSFHYRTPCMSAPTYPADIREVRVFAFDERGLLTASYEAHKLSLSGDYRLETDYHRVGKSTFVAWGGSDLSQYDFSPFVVGRTTREEMIVALARQGDGVSKPLPPLYVGEPVDGPLVQIDRSRLGSHFDEVRFEMHQLTNRIRLTVIGLDPRWRYSARIEDDNSRYHLDGTFADDHRFSYRSPVEEQKGGLLKADFDVLRLDLGRHARLYITDETNHRTIYEANIVEDLIAYRGEYYPETMEPPFSLRCDHLFNIVIRLDDHYEPGTYLALRVVVNEWNMVSRKARLGEEL